jgi:hypothetical protein
VPAPRTSENPVLLPYLSGVPSAGRSLAQHHLDLRLLAERGTEADRQCVVASYGVRVRLGVRLGGALLGGIRKPASRLGLDPIPSAQAIARSEVPGGRQPIRRGSLAQAVSCFGSCTLSLHRPQVCTSSMDHVAGWLSTRVARCLVMEPCRRIHAGDPGLCPGPGLCRNRYLGFRERLLPRIRVIKGTRGRGP